MESDKYFNILAIDGGGIRGLYAAKFLAEFETYLKAQNVGPRLHEHFDLIVGTSTGSIIALALGLGIPAQDIEALYKDKASVIFGKKRFQLNARYHRKSLEQLLKETYRRGRDEDPCLSDMLTRVGVTAYDLVRPTPRVFKAPFSTKYHMDLHIPAYQAALCSGAAPIYFDPYSGSYQKPDGTTEKLNHLVDGGVFANNPAMIALMEAVGGCNIPIERVRLLSIGTGISEYEEARTIKRWGIPYWIKKVRIIDLLFQAQAQHTHDLVNILCGGTGPVKKPLFIYERVQDKLGPTMKISLDCTDTQMLDRLHSLARQTFQQRGASLFEKFIDGKNYADWPPKPKQY